MNRRRSVTSAVVALALTGALLSGCGSSKPAYCSKVADFQSAVRDLKSVDVGKGVSEVTSAAQKVITTGDAAVASVKGEFAPQVSAVKSSLTALRTSLRDLTNPATRSAALARLPAEADALSTAADDLSSKAKSKC